MCTRVYFSREKPLIFQIGFFFLFAPMADTRRDSLVLYLTLHSVFSN